MPCYDIDFAKINKNQQVVSKQWQIIVHGPLIQKAMKAKWISFWMNYSVGSHEGKATKRMICRSTELYEHVTFSSQQVLFEKTIFYTRNNFLAILRTGGLGFQSLLSDMFV